LAVNFESFTYPVSAGIGYGYRAGKVTRPYFADLKSTLRVLVFQEQQPKSYVRGVTIAGFVTRRGV
jgi:hypothetical protein